VLLIYGAYGYTGRLVSERAVELGLRPILSGRDPARLHPLGERLGLETRVADLHPEPLRRALDGVRCVLHCAGPFAKTSKPMVDACLAARAHYLDITGEIPVFEALAERDHEARSAGITLLPGVGFDVVPSDCLALHLKQRLPEAVALTLGLATRGGISHGTASSALLHAENGAMVRRSGKLEKIPLGSLQRTIDFGKGPRDSVAIAWGDVSSAWSSTRIPNIEVYLAVGRLPPGSRTWLPLLQALLAKPSVLRLAQSAIDRAAPGPSEAARQRGSAVVFGEVRDASGRLARARLFTPEGYTLTARASLHVAQKVLAGEAPLGFQTPASAFGPDLALELEGVRREDLESP
jgi:short subunit dehydrogenase-like uncharacterized protein